MNNDEVIELLKEQHQEMMEVALDQKRLMELWTAEDRVNNVRLGLIEEVLKKMLNTGTGLSQACQELLDELKR